MRIARFEHEIHLSATTLTELRAEHITFEKGLAVLNTDLGLLQGLELKMTAADGSPRFSVDIDQHTRAAVTRSRTRRLSDRNQTIRQASILKLLAGLDPFHVW